MMLNKMAHSNPVFPNIFEFVEHQHIKMNKSSFNFKNNLTFKLEFSFFGLHLMIPWGAELAARSPHDCKVVGSNPAGSKKKKKISDLTNKLKPYCSTHGNKYSW